MTINRPYLKESNKALRHGLFANAMEGYIHAVAHAPELSHLSAANVVIASRRRNRTLAPGDERTLILEIGTEASGRQSRSANAIREEMRADVLVMDDEGRVLDSTFPLGELSDERVVTDRESLESSLTLLDIVARNPVDRVHISSDQYALGVIALAFELVWEAKSHVDGQPVDSVAKNIESLLRRPSTPGLRPVLCELSHILGPLARARRSSLALERLTNLERDRAASNGQAAPRAGVLRPLRYSNHDDDKALSVFHKWPPFHDQSDYLAWIRLNDTLTESDKVLIDVHIAEFLIRPRVSVLIVVAPGVTEEQLLSSLASVKDQLYAEWELCIAIDPSVRWNVEPTIDKYCRRNPDVRITRTNPSKSLADSLNDALRISSGDWVVVVSAGDTLPIHAFYHVAATINEQPNACIIYTDQDENVHAHGRSNPQFKPSFDRERLLCQDYVGDLCAYRIDLVRRVGGFRRKYGRAHRWDLLLRLLPILTDDQVVHIPFLLYHRACRMHDSLMAGPQSATADAVAMVNEHFRSHGIEAVARSQVHIPVLQIERRLGLRRPLVSIIIPTKDHAELLSRCVSGVLDRTDYGPIEVVIVDNGSTAPDALALLDEMRVLDCVRVIEDAGPFNFSRLVNEGVAHSSGEVCVLLNNDVDVINQGWLSELVSHAIRPDVGAVGAKLLYPNNTVQHAGVVLGAGSVGGHAHVGLSASHFGYFGRLFAAHSVGAVTGACLATRREIFDSLGGFDDKHLAVSFNDVDYCLRIEEAGLKSIWTPHSLLHHYESISRGHPRKNPQEAANDERERRYMRRVWRKVLDSDPSYNLNLSLDNASFRLANETRAIPPWCRLKFGADGILSQATIQALQENDAKTLKRAVQYQVSHLPWYRRELADYVDQKELYPQKPHEVDRIVVFSAISGGYDSVKMPFYVDPRIDYVLFSDEDVPDTGVWQIRPIPYFDQDRTRVARFIKTHADLLLSEYDLAVWIDSSVVILGDIMPLIDEFRTTTDPIAAIPHPVRNDVVQEGRACIDQNADDKSVINEQMLYYQETGVGIDDLIESNLMMFKLRDRRTTQVLSTWWSQILAYSRRDQLSLVFALQTTGSTWHRIWPRPNSIRNSELFAYVSHGEGGRVASKLIDSMGLSKVAPYRRGSYSCVKNARISGTPSVRVQVVVCVHNALIQVKNCLESVIAARVTGEYGLIVIDDGSDPPTQRYLEQVVDGLSWAELHRNNEPTGYTKAANTGLAASTADFVVLLNSDTVVSEDWTNKLVDAAYSMPRIGIVGPLSNAASHQSIPSHHGSQSQTATNRLPAGLSVADMNAYCERWSPGDFLPLVPLVHGFCFGVKREVIDEISFLDEEAFPSGYGEENDYCFRAVDAGFALAIATHTFVYHEKSSSYDDARREALTAAGLAQLRARYGKRRLQRAVASMDHNPHLQIFRDRAAELESDPSRSAAPPRRRAFSQRTHPKTVFALIPRGLRGNPEGTGEIRVVRPLEHHTMQDLLRLKLGGLSDLDAPCDVLLVLRDAVRSLRDAEQIITHVQRTGIPLIYETDDDLLSVPLDHSSASRFDAEAVDAMRMLLTHASAVVVSTDALKDRFATLNESIHVIPNALDESLWCPSGSLERTYRQDMPLTIGYMGTRTHTHDLALLMEPIMRLQRRFKDNVAFRCIGGFAGEPSPPFRSAAAPASAVRSYPDFARWMGSSNLFDIALAPLADSEFNCAKSHIKYLDYGITGLPMVLSNLPQYSGVATHRETGLLVGNTSEEWYNALLELIENHVLRERIGRNAFSDVWRKHTLSAQADSRRSAWKALLAPSVRIVVA